MLGTDYIIAPKIPRGLAPAVEGLAREILRQRPRDIYTFASRHFEKLIELRDEERVSGALPENVSRRHLQKYSRISACTGPNDAENCEDGHVGTGKCSVAARDATGIKKERMPSMVIKKLPKKKKDAANASGWSIHETCKVLRKHKRANDAEKEKLSNIEANEKSIENKMAAYSQEYSPPFSGNSVHGYLARSSSVGSVPTNQNNLKSRSKDDRERARRSAVDNKRDAANSDSDCSKKYKYTNVLSRQRSVDRVESFWSHLRETEQPNCLIGRRRSRSLVNDSGLARSSSSNDELGLRLQHVNGDRIFRNCQFGSVAEGQEADEKKSVQKLNGVEETVAKLNEDGSQSENSSNSVQGGASSSRSVDRNASVVLPSVVPRQCSGKCSRNSAQNLNREQDDSGNLTLPPIASEVSKSSRTEDDLTLPLVLGSRDAQADLDWYREEPSPEFEETNGLEDAAIDETMEETEKKGEDSQASNEGKNDDIDIQERPVLEELATSNESGVLEETDVMLNADSQEADFEESFKDSLNVTPDSMGVPQRPDSLEPDPEDRNEEPLAVVDDEKKEEEPERSPSNELKRKLIEIEMVERKIENTLVSSQTVPACDDFEESRSTSTPMIDVESETVDLAQGNESTVIEGKEDESRILDLDEGGTSSIVEEKNSDESVEINSVNNGSADKSSPNNSQVSSSRDADPGPSNDGETLEEAGKKVDASCRVLTEGSPYEIPETVTTVAVPDGEEHRCGTLESAEQYRQDSDGFGEYVQPEVSDSPALADAQLLADIKSAADRAGACKDLENIKEEEENESGRLSREVAEGNVASLVEESHPLEDENRIDLESKLARSNGEEEIVGGEMQISDTAAELEKRETEEDIDDTIAKEAGLPEEEGRKVSNNHSSDFSLSFATPHVPELNLDSLQDTTISSFERSDSKAIERQSELGNGNITPRNEENEGSSSVDTLPSGRNMATLSSEDESSRGKFSGGSKDSKDGTECKSELSAGDKQVDVAARDKGERSPSSIEEEIAKELIENLVRDTAMIQGLTLDIEESAHPERIDNGEQTYKKEEQERKEDKENEKTIEGEETDEDSNGLEKRVESKECQISEEIAVAGEKSLGTFNLRHTGEFHDSLPLSIVELPKGIPALNISTGTSADQTRDSCILLRTNFMGNQGSAIVSSVTVSKTEPFKAIVSHAIDLSKNLSSLDQKAGWAEWWLNVPHSIGGAEQTINDVDAKNENRSNFDTDIPDTREPLALDNSPKRVIIEEVVDDEEDKKEEKVLA